MEVLPMSTKTEKLAAIDARIAKLQQQRDELAAAPDTDLFSKITTGDRVIAEYGRGEKRRTVEGTVLGKKPAEGKAPAQVRIAVGEGFDAEVLTVPTAAVTAVLTQGEQA